MLRAMVKLSAVFFLFYESSVTKGGGEGRGYESAIASKYLVDTTCHNV